jgi:muramoyltetrapeptide carboxypeptidase
MRFPDPLRPGARVALVAPSGPLRGESDLEKAVSNTEAFGWTPVVGEHVLERDGYLAGSDAHRIADLNRAAADDAIDAVWCIRGGYGAMRLLDDLDLDAWRGKPKALIGYSDITALHAAVGRHANLVTFHGPTARGELTPFTRDSFASVVRGDEKSWAIEGPALQTLHAGKASGRLTGGNLALVAALVGTPHALDLDGAILVLEDVSEQIYRLDRMLWQLWLSGALRNVAGLVFGQFTDIQDDPANAERPLERLLREFAAKCDVPCIMNFPIGHVDDFVTLPLGANAQLDANAATLTIHS